MDDWLDWSWPTEANTLNAKVEHCCENDKVPMMDNAVVSWNNSSDLLSSAPLILCDPGGCPMLLSMTANGWVECDDEQKKRKMAQTFLQSHSKPLKKIHVGHLLILQFTFLCNAVPQQIDSHGMECNVVVPWIAIPLQSFLVWTESTKTDMQGIVVPKTVPSHIHI